MTNVNRIWTEYREKRASEHDKHGSQIKPTSEERRRYITSREKYWQRRW